MRQWAPLVWLAPGEKFMPTAVTDFLHHVHAEKSKNPSPSNNKDTSTNENNLYLLQQHQQQLSDQLTEQFLRRRQQQHQQAANRRDDNNVESHGVPNPWERRNKRTYRDENQLMDYIIDMPVGEISENWFLVTNDDIGI